MTGKHFFVAALAAACLTIAEPAAGGWLARGMDIADVGIALKRNMSRLIGLADEATGAVIEGNRPKFEKALREAEKTPYFLLSDALGRDAHPVLRAPTFAISAGKRIRTRLKTAEKKIRRFADTVRENLFHAGALATQRNLGSPRKTPSPVASARSGKSESNAPPPARDPWGAVRADPWATNDPWELADGSGNRSTRVVQSTSPWDPAPKRRNTGDCAKPGFAGNAAECKDPAGETATDAAGYNAVLASALGETGDDYLQQLESLERKEAERRRREAEEAERRRREAEEAERRRREAEEERRRHAAAEQRRRREAEEAERLQTQRRLQQAKRVTQQLAAMLRQDLARRQAEEERRRRAAAEQRRRREAEEAERRRREAEEAERLQTQQQALARRQQADRERQQADRERQRRAAALRQEREARRRAEEERRRAAAEERRRREEERLAKLEEERLAKEARRDACRQKIAGSRTGCVQIGRWHRSGSYTLRNTCGYPIAVYHKHSGQGGYGLIQIGPGGTRWTAPVYADGRRQRGIRYHACYDAPGVGSRCELFSWACHNGKVR